MRDVMTMRARPPPEDTYPFCVTLRRTLGPTADVEYMSDMNRGHQEAVRRKTRAKPLPALTHDVGVRSFSN